eukprot:715370-Pelagomonas_calceolata.AAC.3
MSTAIHYLGVTTQIDAAHADKRISIFVWVGSMEITQKELVGGRSQDDKEAKAKIQDVIDNSESDLQKAVTNAVAVASMDGAGAPTFTIQESAVGSFAVTPKGRLLCSHRLSLGPPISPFKKMLLVNLLPC